MVHVGQEICIEHYLETVAARSNGGVGPTSGQAPPSTRYR
jgi:hypothetical protein